MGISMITSITMSNSAAQSGTIDGASLNTANWHSSTQQQEPIQKQNTAHIDETRSEPAAPKTNSTLPTQTASVQQESNPES
jgi:hypothetical protein